MECFPDRKRVMDLMLMLGLNETINQLAMANSIGLHGHVMRRKDGHVLTRSLNIEFEGQRRKRRLKRT